MKNIVIKGTGKSLPDNLVTAEMIDKKLNLKKGETFKITGLQERHFLGSQPIEELVIEATNQALFNANLKLEDIDCIISSNASMQQMLPYDAAGIHKILNLRSNISSFDINMTCLSALRALEISSNLLDSYPTILIISCEVPSVAQNWDNLRTAGIFSDGCSAMIVQKSSKGGILVSNFETHPEGFEHCQVRGGGVKNSPNEYPGDYKEVGSFEMNGKKLFKLTLSVLPDFIHNTLKSENLSLKDIDWVVPHQASQASIKHMTRILKIDKEKLIDIFVNHGNQVAASIPTALHELLTTRNVKSGDKVMMIGTSAGLGLGIVVLEMP